MTKEIKPASPRQIAYLQNLEKQLGYKVHRYEHMPLWKATKRIDELKKRLDNRNRQLSIYEAISSQ